MNILTLLGLVGSSMAALAVYQPKNVDELLELSSAVVVAKYQATEWIEGMHRPETCVIAKVLFADQTARTLKVGSKIVLSEPLFLSDSFMKRHGIPISSKAPTFPDFNLSENQTISQTPVEVIVFLRFLKDWHLAAAHSTLTATSDHLSKVQTAIANRPSLPPGE